MEKTFPQVQITVTGETSSRVKVVYEPGKKGRRALLYTGYGPQDWERMRTDRALAEHVARLLAVPVDVLLNALGSVQTQAHYVGPVLYRAACGREQADLKPGRKPKRLKEVLMGWVGNPDAAMDWARRDGALPKECVGCPRLKVAAREFVNRETDQFYTVTMHLCPTFTVVPGVRPGEEASVG